MAAEIDGDADTAADGEAVAAEGEVTLDAFGELVPVAAGAVADGVEPPHATADRAMLVIKSAIRLLVRSTSEPSLEWVRRAVPALRV